MALEQNPTVPAILPFHSPQCDLALAGGKGANLSRMARADFPVPPGFIITVEGYRSFVSANRLDAVIEPLLVDLAPTDPNALEMASHRIRASFSAGILPQAIHTQIISAYREMGNSPVAVRSSATAEDLPEFSFAGQQDTYLNILGEEAFLAAVVNCWSSLWTARAIGYRLRNHINHLQVSLAVVVQCMVESEVSGVLFTANPLTGLRSELVIDAAFGLGEALVSGQVEPDQYIVDPFAGIIRQKKLGRKARSIHGQASGGTRADELDRSTLQALPDNIILQLTALAQRVAEIYRFPQDIEWAWAQGSLYLLQTRPITSLFPIPETVNAGELKILNSFGGIQGILSPITPLGRETMMKIFAAGTALFGYRHTARTQTVLHEAGERLWVNITPLVKNSVGRGLMRGALAWVDPAVEQILATLIDDPRFKPTRKGISLHARSRLARFFSRLLINVIPNMIAPVKRRESIRTIAERVLIDLRKRSADIKGDRGEILIQRAVLLDGMMHRLPTIFIRLVSTVVVGMAAWNLLRLVNPYRSRPSSPKNEDWNRWVTELTRGMPYNPTTEMDLALWDIARGARQDPDQRVLFETLQAGQIADGYHSGQLPRELQSSVRMFLERYGGRGLGEIDLGRTRWADDPTHVFEMLAGLVRISDPAVAPDAIFARSATAAENAIAEMRKLARSASGGWFRAHLVDFLSYRARNWLGMREYPKFFAVRMLAQIQHEILSSGKDYTAAGLLDQPDDLFYLNFDEIRSFARSEARDWHALISQRRESYQRELRRRQIPRLLLSDGRAFYEGIRSTKANAILGSPVSPGSIKGRVRVVFDPSHANLQPGEILVCPGTDPSWTPLFLTASGLVMEVGGMMTHGAVVAREYGIPAVVGVHEATTQLQTGMWIQLDGSSGEIDILEGTPE
jgi:pyruvate,water dikinase